MKYYYPALLLCLIVCCCSSENEDPAIIELTPDYNKTGIITSKDTTIFQLDDSTYNDIRSISFFSESGNNFISLYDHTSQSINIYDWNTHIRTVRINLKTCLRSSHLYKVSVYTKNFDSIFVTNNTNLYLLNKSGRIVNKVSYASSPEFAWPFFDTNNPAIKRNNILFTAVRPFVKETSIKSIKKWKNLYEFNIDEKKTSLNINYPKALRTERYGHRFLRSSFCETDRNTFLLSFAGDTNIYETTSTQYLRAYKVKSKHHATILSPMTDEDFKNEHGQKLYDTNYSYDYIYADPQHHKYLRVAKHPIEEKNHDVPRQKRQSIIILDHKFQIIGESTIDNNISLDQLFWANDGHMYCRVNKRNEYSVSFIKLLYQE